MRARGIVLAGYVLAFVIGAIAIGLVYWRGYKAGGEAVRLEWSEANRLQRESEAKQAAKAAGTLEAKREKAKVVTETVRVEVDRIVERPVYRNVCIDADGLCLANAAISGKSADTCKPDKSLSPAQPAPGRNGRLGLALDYGDRGLLQRLPRETPGAG